MKDEQYTMLEGITDPRVKVKLMKMSKGYQWEISISGDDPAACVQELRDTDRELSELYPEGGK